ncbi:MAG: phage capsid protein, partial [Belnapia sp.]|nr:phage capsid protein [Belnapia sp.]
MTEPARLELLRLAQDALVRLAPTLPAEAVALLVRLHADVPSAEFEPPEAMAAGAASLFTLARDRPAGTARLRLLPPAAVGGPHAVVEIVTDDMPFLVDSVLGALARQGRVLRQLLHPVLAVRRNAAGRLLALEEGQDTVAESMMRITLGAAPATLLAGQPGAASGDWVAL